MDETLVGQWDCHTCGRKGIWGYIYNCPGCGKPRSRNVEFYLSEDAPVATAEQAALMGHDPNWYCLACDSGNLDSNTVCWNCRTEKGKASPHHTETYVGDGPQSENEVATAPRVQQDQPSYLSEAFTRAESYHVFYDGEDTNKTESRAQQFSPLMKVIGGVSLFLLALFVIHILTSVHDSTASVVGFEWSQTVQVEEYKTVQDTGWSIPSGGREVRHEQKESGKKKVHDGWKTVKTPYDCSTSKSETYACTKPQSYTYPCTKNNGNGSFTRTTCTGTKNVPSTCTRQVRVPKTCYKDDKVELFHYDPVYSTWYIYDIERWVLIGNYPTSGTDHKPYFANVTISANQRKYERDGRYIVHFTSEEIRGFDQVYDKATFLLVSQESTYPIKVNAAKMIVEFPKIKAK